MMVALAAALLGGCNFSLGGKSTGKQASSEVTTSPAAGQEEAQTSTYTPLPPPKEAIVYKPIPKDINLDVTDEMLLKAQSDVKNWLTYNHDFTSQRYVNLKQINTSNVKNLRPAYVVQTGITDGFETTPIVVNGVMFFTTSEGPQVWAVDAKTGEKYWVYAWPYPKGLPLCCGPVNRGVAVYRNKVFFLTLDAHLVALDAYTGKLLWATQVADPREGYSETHAPIAFKNHVFVGVSGAEFGIKGWIRAYDPDTGKMQWHFDTVNFSFGWGKDPSVQGGGSTWMSGSIDPETNTLFWGVGNPSPDFDGSVRPGSNPYTNSTVALDLDTGKLKWYYQYTPHDLWDYDSVTPPVLVPVRVRGRTVPGLVHCDKNGYCYTHERSTGKLLVKSEEFVIHKNFMKAPTSGGIEICPGPAGGTEWVPIAYHPETEDVYVSGINMCARYTSHAQHFVKGRAYWGSAFVPLVGKASGTFTAIDVNTGKITWQYKAPQPMVGGALTTAGGLVFTGEQNGYFEAFDVKTGKLLWRFQTGAGIHAPPITFEIDGKQYVAVASGDGGWTAGFGAVGIPNYPVTGGQKGDALFVFALP